MAKRGFPTNKEMVNALGEKYVSLDHNGGYCLYDKERKSTRANYSFLGKYYISNDRKHYVFNDDSFSTPEELVEAMERYNATLPFSADIYDPIYRKHCKIEFALHDYLSSLGFKMEWGKGDPAFGTVYSVKDMYGSTMMEIMVHVKQDTTEGCIYRNITESKWTEAAFTDLDSAVGAVNSVLSAYLTTFNAQVVNMFSKMTTARASAMLTKSFDINTLTTYAEDAKQAMIKTLEAELERLKQ